MKKFALKAAALAIAGVCGSVYAGTITAPATPTKYAVEAMTAATPVTLPAITYQMGVGRPIGNGFTFIVTPSVGATFATVLGVQCPIPVYVGPSTVSITVKRQSTIECAYDVQVATLAITVGDTFTVNGLALATHPLATAGGSVNVNVNLKDPGETAQIDNTNTLAVTVANSVQAINIYAATSDTATVADVNAVGGPLTGFVAGGAAPVDTTTVAAAWLTFDNNSANAKDATGAANFDFTNAIVTGVGPAGTGTGTAAIALTGSTIGLKASKFCIDLDNDTTLCEAGEVLTANATGGTLSGITVAAFPVQGTTATRTVTFEVTGTTPLGTSRNFALTGTVTPAVGAVEALADTASKNATAWVWGANASQLMTSYMSTNGRFVTRFSMLNTGAAAVGYSVQCYAEGANVATNGANGTLKAAGTTVLDAGSVCSFSDATVPRGAVIFTINAPIGTVKGSYNIVDAVTGANGFLPLVRPYGTATTE
ncbi:MAG: hypothetical protein Q8K96_14330 [Rubrivivax sp.]|nr:hypothetical protein [Rubrivivax sp.]